MIRPDHFLELPLTIEGNQWLVEVREFRDTVNSQFQILVGVHTGWTYDEVMQLSIQTVVYQYSQGRELVNKTIDLMRHKYTEDEIANRLAKYGLKET